MKVLALQQIKAEYNSTKKIAHVVGKAVWDDGAGIRDVISIGKLVRKSEWPEANVQEISIILMVFRHHFYNTGYGFGNYFQ